MSLTRKDIELIQDALKPEFDRIHSRLDSLEKRMDSLEKRMDILELKVNMLETTLTAAFREIVDDIYNLSPSRDEFNKLEGRVTHIEQKIH